MKRLSFKILAAALFVVTFLSWGDLLQAQMTNPANSDQMINPANSVAMSRYDMRISSYKSLWESLIPTQFIVQNAGNMGILSFGIGWDYGRGNQWETHLMLGWIPKYHNNGKRVTMTLKETYIPWHIPIEKYKNRGKGSWSLEPLSAGLYLNTVFGREFWQSQPSRYPDKYYEFLSTRLRVNIFLGQRITKIIPNAERKFIKNATFFYELSTCDLYIRAMFQNSGIALKEIVSLSLGCKVQFF